MNIFLSKQAVLSKKNIYCNTRLNLFEQLQFLHMHYAYSFSTTGKENTCWQNILSWRTFDFIIAWQWLCTFIPKIFKKKGGVVNTRNHFQWKFDANLDIYTKYMYLYQKHFLTLRSVLWNNFLNRIRWIDN